MRSTILALGTALALAVPAAPAAAVRDFRLPPGPSQQQPPPDRQGPVAPDVPESRAPTPTPTPTAVRPSTPAPTPTPTLVLPPETGQTAGSRPAPAVRSTPTARTPEAASPVPTATQDSPPGSPEPTLPAFEGLPQASPSAASPDLSEAGGAWWPWALAGLLGLGAVLGLAGWLWRRRENAPLVVPQVERPRLAPEPPAPPAGAVVPEPASTEPLQVTLEPLRLSLTLLNATLAYRLQLANRGASALTGLSIGADMIAAHASMSREEQLAGPAGGGAELATIERLEPGESRIVEGEFRVPFSQIVPIRQGKAALLLPLARFRLEAEGAAPVVRTFVVGQPGAQAGLQPFRLDLGPRVYPNLAQRAFA